MKLFRQFKRPDPVQVKAALSQGYGVKHPERISGFNRFLFSPGDVWISDYLAQELLHDKGLAGFLTESIARFNKEDYGDISKSDVDRNSEGIWLGNGFYLFARYPYRDEVIRVRNFPRFTYMCIESELDPSPDEELKYDQPACIVD